MDLAKCTLGRTGLSVTRLGYGAMELAGIKGSIDPADAHKLLNHVLDSGINFIDTSPDYGASEELIGASISGRRDEFFLASKCGCPVTIPFELKNGRPVHLFTADNVRAGVEQSLTRMRTDHLDLVQVHTSPSRAQLERDDVVATLQGLQQQGKLRFIGMSGVLPDLLDHIEMGVFDAFQIPYSALERDHERAIADAAEGGAGTIIRGGVARGAPAPDQNPDQEPDWGRNAMLTKRDLWQEAKLDELLSGMSRMEFMLRFTLSHPDIHTIIVGTSSPSHLDENVRAASANALPADLYSEAKRRLSTGTP